MRHIKSSLLLVLLIMFLSASGPVPTYDLLFLELGHPLYAKADPYLTRAIEAQIAGRVFNAVDNRDGSEIKLKFRNGRFIMVVNAEHATEVSRVSGFYTYVADAEYNRTGILLYGWNRNLRTDVEFLSSVRKILALNTFLSLSNPKYSANPSFVAKPYSDQMWLYGFHTFASN